MCIPKEEKKGLGITFPFILFQILIPIGKQITIDVKVIGERNERRCINFGRVAK